MAPAIPRLSPEPTIGILRRTGSRAGGGGGETELREKRRGGERGFTIIELLVATVIIVIIATIALATIINALDTAKQRATMAEMRTISEVIEIYITDSRVPPADGGGITALVAVLAPHHSSPLPTRDHWGHTYAYTSDGAGNYTIESHGKDGADGSDITLGSRFDFDLDIVLSNGVFVAAPE